MHARDSGPAQMHMPRATAPWGRGGSGEGSGQGYQNPGGTATNSEWRLERWGNTARRLALGPVHVWIEVSLTIVLFVPKVLIRSARRARRRFVP